MLLHYTVCHNSEAADLIGQRKGLLMAHLLYTKRQCLAKLEWYPVRCNKCLRPAANTWAKCISLGMKEERLERPLSPFNLKTHWNVVVLFPSDCGFGNISAEEKKSFLGG